jgi:heat-inducible transcriptional repressor
VVNLPQLSDRAQHLLKVLIERYIDDGQPVGSRALAKDTGLNLSPATIRNVMADLEELGLITAPHTSAGRMPTVTGYRFFVNSLLTVKPLKIDLIKQLRHDLDHWGSPDEILETASRILSEATHMAGLVSMPRREKIIFRHIEFLPLSEQRILVILVTDEHEVQNKIIHAPKQFHESSLQEAANLLNSFYAGKDLSLIRDNLARDLQEIRERLQQEIIEAALMAEMALNKPDRGRKSFVLTGETNLMDFSELASMNHLRGLFETFHQQQDIVQLIDRCLTTQGISIFIGEESGYQALNQCSLVTASYSVDDKTLGVLGVIGPTRMEYERVIPLVDLTAKLVGAALNFKSQPPSCPE